MAQIASSTEIGGAHVLAGKGPATAISPAKIMALLTSRQFDVIYEVPYRGDEEEVGALLTRCEGLKSRISNTTHAENLIVAVEIIDGCLIGNLPTAEVRSLIKTIVEKDPNLINHMPQIKRMLSRVYRAVVLSTILDAKTIRQIREDVDNRNKWNQASD